MGTAGVGIAAPHWCHTLTCQLFSHRIQKLSFRIPPRQAVRPRRIFRARQPPRSTAATIQRLHRCPRENLLQIAGDHLVAFLDA